MTTIQDTLKLIQITPGRLFYKEFAGFSGTESPAQWLQELNIPNPSSVNWEGIVLTNEEKNAKGDLFIEFVNKKRKVTVNWEFLTQAQYRNLLGHLSIDFNRDEQSVLYYKVKALNPNNADYYEEGGMLQPKLDEMIAYLEGRYVGKVAIYNSTETVDKITESVAEDNTDIVKKNIEKIKIPFTIVYQDVTLVFIER